MDKGWRRVGFAGLSTIVATTAITGIAPTSANAVTPIVSFTTAALVAELPLATGVSLGTQKLAETTAGSVFVTGSTSVVLTLNAGTFTPDVTPTIVVPSGYASSSPATTAAGTYTFTVDGPAAPIAATVSVSGLTIVAPGTAQTLTLDAQVGATNVDALPVVNVVKFDARTGGGTRYDTAAKLFDSEFSGAQDVVLSSGAAFPDAMSASYLAGLLSTGTLLTKPDTLSAEARGSMIRSGVDTVYITGGLGAVSQAVENQIKAIHVGDVSTASLIKVVRIDGQDRYETNLNINEYFRATPSTVLLASSKNFPDGLALGPVAYQGFPLILTGGTILGESESIQLADFAPTNVVIAGGPAVVSTAVETSLKAKGYNVLRLFGKDRTLTAAAIAGWATDGIAGAAVGTIGAAQGAFTDTTYIAAGSGFADALAAGPVAGINGRMILLSNSPTVLGLGIPAYLGTKTVGVTADSSTEVGTLHAIGEVGSVPAALMKAAAATIGR